MLLSLIVILRTTRVSHSTSFRPTTLAGRMSVTDDIQTDRPRYGEMCHNWRNRFQQCGLKLPIFATAIAKIKVAAELFMVHSV